jgi:hypothetical protein
VPAAVIAAQVVPDRRSSQKYLYKLIDAGRIADAQAMWALAVSHGYVDDQLATRYVDLLLANKMPESAARDWASYAGSRSAGYPERNRIFNGDFEKDPTGSAFDWRLDKVAGTSIDFDRGIKHSGDRSLRIRFDGTANPGDLGVLERVFLEPGRYRFQAFVRTQDLSTDEGVAFRIVCDDAPKELDWSTNHLRGTNDWTLSKGEFGAPTGGGLVSVRLMRRPSLKFDNLLKGTAWLDGVIISPLTP